MTVKKPDPPVQHPQDRWGVPFRTATSPVAPLPVAPPPDPPEVNVELHTTRPAPGTYGVLVAVIDDQGRVRQAVFSLSDVDRSHLEEHEIWLRHFLPALVTIGMESSLQPAHVDRKSSV